MEGKNTQLLKQSIFQSELTSVADRSRVASVSALATEDVRALQTNSSVLAWIWVASVNHLARVEDDFILAAIFLNIDIYEEFVKDFFAISYTLSFQSVGGL
jgi:hypothetical protein